MKRKFRANKNHQRAGVATLTSDEYYTSGTGTDSPLQSPFALGIETHLNVALRHTFKIAKLLLSLTNLPKCESPLSISFAVDCLQGTKSWLDPASFKTRHEYHMCIHTAMSPTPGRRGSGCWGEVGSVYPRAGLFPLGRWKHF